MCEIVESMVEELVSENKIEIAKTMLTDNMSHEAVAKYSGLSIEEAKAHKMSQ